MKSSALLRTNRGQMATWISDFLMLSQAAKAQERCPNFYHCAFKLWIVR